MAKKESVAFRSLLQEIQQKKFKPIYLLMGEESYYIDRLAEAFQEHVLSEDEKDFNERILFGNEVDISYIVSEAKYFPSFADRRLVIVKESQHIKQWDDLIHYLSQPMQSTVLVLCYKNGKMDGRSAIYKEIDKQGIIFESPKLYDNQLPDWINQYVQSKRLSIEPKGAGLMAEYIGSDLNRLSGELEKLIVSLPENSTNITLDLIERNIGISKEFNSFELVKAIAQKDFYRSNFIAKQLGKNPKNNPLPVTLSSLFNLFSKLMLAHYLPDKSENGLKQSLGLNYYQAQDMSVALKRYSASKTMQIIRLLRDTDARYKGFKANATDESQLLSELIFKIFV